jgi:hypothetical protein
MDHIRPADILITARKFCTKIVPPIGWTTVFNGCKVLRKKPRQRNLWVTDTFQWRSSRGLREPDAPKIRERYTVCGSIRQMPLSGGWCFCLTICVKRKRPMFVAKGNAGYGNG